jgi:hypothetical protein
MDCEFLFIAAGNVVRCNKPAFGVISTLCWFHMNESLKSPSPPCMKCTSVLHSGLFTFCIVCKCSELSCPNPAMSSASTCNKHRVRGSGSTPATPLDPLLLGLTPLTGDVTGTTDKISVKPTAQDLPHKCGKCGSPAYIGFLNTECSSSKCTNYKKPATVPKHKE